MAVNYFKADMNRNIRFMIYLRSKFKTKTFYIQDTFRKYFLSTYTKFCTRPWSQEVKKTEALSSRNL